MPQRPTYFKERKEFVRRMVNEDQISWAKEMQLSKTLFQKYSEHIEFLDKLKRPFELNSIAWFLSPNGEKFLNDKLVEFYYKPKETEKVVDYGRKFGEDIIISRKPTLRQFIDG